MSVIVANAGAAPPGGGGGGAALSLYTENPVSPAPPLAQGDNSVAIGPGTLTDPAATNGIALGSQSLARHIGSQVFANGRFGSTGDAQVGHYLLRTHTVNDAFTDAFLDGTGGSARLVLPDNATWTFKITITAHRTDAAGGHAGYKVEGVIFRDSGAATTAFQGSPVKTVLAESDPQWDINITADTTNGSLRIQVQGQSGKTIRWLAHVETLEVTN